MNFHTHTHTYIYMLVELDDSVICSLGILPLLLHTPRGSGPERSMPAVHTTKTCRLLEDGYDPFEGVYEVIYF